MQALWLLFFRFYKAYTRIIVESCENKKKRSQAKSNKFPNSIHLHLNIVCEPSAQIEGKQKKKSKINILINLFTKLWYSVSLTIETKFSYIFFSSLLSVSPKVVISSYFHCLPGIRLERNCEFG